MKHKDATEENHFQQQHLINKNIGNSEMIREILRNVLNRHLNIN